jgi:PAS domain S-box-containing protein
MTSHDQTAEALLAAIVSSSDDAIVSKTLDGVITSWNHGAERVFGYRADEAIGQSILLIIPPDRRDEEVEIIQRIRRGERVEHFETVRVAKDGRRLDVSISISPVRGADGAIVGASKVARDVTERKAAEARAQHSQDLLRLIADNVPALISYIDRDFTYRLNNRAYEDWFGPSADHMVGRRVADVLGAAAWEKLRPYMEAALRGERVSYEDYIPYPTGARWIQATYVPDVGADGAVRGFAVLVHDIDARRRSEEAHRLLVALHDATRGLDDPAAVMLEIATIVGRRFRAVRCAYGEFDAGRRELLITPGYRDGVPSVAGAHPIERFGGALRDELMAGRTVAVRDVREDSRTNEPKQMATWDALEIRSLICAPIVKAGRPVAVLVVADRAPRDWASGEAWLLEQVAERTFFAVEGARAAASLRESRDELRRLNVELSEADHRKDEFLAMLAHELRNPLAAISNAASILRLEGPESPALQEACGIVDRQVRHLSRLVEDLLDVSRIRRGRVELRREPVALASIVAGAAEAARSLAAEKEQHLTVAVPAEPLHVLADPTRLEQVLQNLVGNAVRYTQAGGHIEVVAERDGREAVLRVRDDGAGIPPGMLLRIFEPFTQLDRSLERSAGGLGIGLALVQRLVELHGGRVEAREIGKQQADDGPVLVALTGWGQDEDRRRTREAGFAHHLVKPVELSVVRELLASVSGRGAGDARTDGA